MEWGANILEKEESTMFKAQLASHEFFGKTFLSQSKYKQKGMNKIWWNEVIYLSLVVWGQVMYLILLKRNLLCYSNQELLSTQVTTDIYIP